MSEKLLGLLRKQEWIHRDRLERAQAANKAVHDRIVLTPIGQPVEKYPFTVEQITDLELAMLRAQIELEREETDETEPQNESEDVMPFFQLLLKILAILGPILNTPTAQKILTCIMTQSGVPAILACIVAAAPVPSAPVEEKTAHADVVSALQAHIAANP